MYDQNSVMKFSYFPEKHLCRKFRFTIDSYLIYQPIFLHIMIHKGQIRPLWIAEMLQFMK